MKQSEDTRSIFASIPVRKAIRIMAVPTIISQLTVLVYNMADTFYLGRTGNPYMVAGASIILPVFNITLSLAGLAGTGGGTLISRLLGQERLEEAKEVSAFSIYLSIALTALFALLVAVFMRPLLHALGAGENTFAYAEQYAFCVVVLGGVPTVLSNVLANLLRSAGYSKKAGFGITLGGVLNILLDPLLMFVLLPKGYEVLGVGIATCLSNITACLYFSIAVLRKQRDGVLSWSMRLGRPEKSSIRSLFTVGIPSALATLLFDMDYIVLDKLMASYGDVALAAIGIVLKVERLPLNVGVGICQGMVPLVAYNYSAKNFGRMQDVLRHSRALGLIVAGVSICLYELFAPNLIGFFISNSETIAIGTGFIRARILATPFMFLSFFTVYLFNAFGEGMRAMFLGIVRWGVLNIPMLFLLNALFGMSGLVWAQISADMLNVALSLFVLHRFKKRLAKEGMPLQ